MFVGLHILIIKYKERKHVWNMGIEKRCVGEEGNVNYFTKMDWKRKGEQWNIPILCEEKEIW